MSHLKFKGLVAGAALSIFAQGAVAQEITWDLALFGSPAFRVAGESFAEYVNENSGGKMQITVHNGTLSPSREVLDNLSVGAFELGYVISSYHPGKNPLISVPADRLYGRACRDHRGAVQERDDCQGIRGLEHDADDERRHAKL